MKTKKLAKKKVLLPDSRYLLYYGWTKKDKIRKKKSKAKPSKILN